MTLKRRDIGAEDRSRELVAVHQIGNRDIAPGKANGDRTRHLPAVNQDRVTINSYFGGMKLFICTGDCEIPSALACAASCFLSASASV
jgi:hypothetical protein